MKNPESDTHGERHAKGECAFASSGKIDAYLDGDLDYLEQPGLFNHLASCASCRRMMDSVLMFRRMSRQELISISPASDDEFFRRLAQQKERSGKFDRKDDRKPLWNVRRSISVRTAVFLAAAVFVIGILVPTPVRMEYIEPLISMEVERVQFNPTDYVYVIYPGLTVEALSE